MYEELKWAKLQKFELNIPSHGVSKLLTQAVRVAIDFLTIGNSNIFQHLKEIIE